MPPRSLRPIPDGTLNAYPIDPAIKNPRLNGTSPPPARRPTGLSGMYDFDLHQSLHMFGHGGVPARQRRRGSESPTAGQSRSLF